MTYHNCSPNQHPWLPDASEKSRSTFPNRQTKLTLAILTHRLLSTNNLNTKFHCAFSAMTVPISLSLSTPVPILPGKQQCFRLQSQGYQSVQTSVKLHCSCTLPNLRCPLYTHYITNVATKPRSLTKQTRPSRFSCQRFSNMWQLNQGHRPSRFSCQCFSLQLSSPGMTPGSVAPRTVHSVRPGSTTT